MSALQQLYNLLVLENALGIYRNYYNEDKTMKCCIILHIFVQTLLHSIIVAGQLYLLLIDDPINYIHCEFSISSFMTALLSVFTGISNSHAFVSLIQTITRVNKRFEGDKKYIKSLRNNYLFSIIFIILSVTFTIFRTLDLIITFEPTDYDMYVILCVPAFISQAFIRFTILFEKLVLFIFIMVIVNCTKCLNVLISTVQDRVGKYDVSSDEQCDITRDQIQEWVELYQDIAYSCDKIALCFGRQFYFSLITSVSYYILLTYQICYLSVLNKSDQKIAIVIICYALLTTFPIVGGQWACNHGMEFRQILARLYNTVVVFDSNEVEVKLIKDFIRIIKKKPIEIKLFSNIPAGMYMVPVIVMASVNYIIVMLQFGNIV